jgi:hypothetical protein
MNPLKIWNYMSLGVLALAGSIFALLLLSAHSYRLMGWFFAVAQPIAISLFLLAIAGLIAIPFLGLAQRTKWRQAGLGLGILILSAVVFLEVVFTKYQVTTSASFDRQTYYLVKFLQVDSYTYRVYRCGALDLFCHRSAGYIGIPNQHTSIRFQQDLQTKRVYIQNGDRAIEIPDYNGPDS